MTIKSDYLKIKLKRQYLIKKAHKNVVFHSMFFQSTSIIFEVLLLNKKKSAKIYARTLERWGTNKKKIHSRISNREKKREVKRYIRSNFLLWKTSKKWQNRIKILRDNKAGQQGLHEVSSSPSLQPGRPACEHIARALADVEIPKQNIQIY